MRAIVFMLENYQIVLVSSVVIIGALYFFRDKFVSEEQKNDEPRL